MEKKETEFAYLFAQNFERSILRSISILFEEVQFGTVCPPRQIEGGFSPLAPLPFPPPLLASYLNEFAGLKEGTSLISSVI